jgi:hypothetical protein
MEGQVVDKAAVDYKAWLMHELERARGELARLEVGVGLMDQVPGSLLMVPPNSDEDKARLKAKIAHLSSLAGVPPNDDKRHGDA